MFVKDYMFKGVEITTVDASVADVVKKMVETKSNSLIVVDAENKPIGTVSARALLKSVIPEYLKMDTITASYDVEGTFEKYVNMFKDKKVGEIMYTEIKVLTEDDALIEAAVYAIKGTRRILPVINKKTGKLVGAMTRTNLKNALYDVIYPANNK